MKKKIKIARKILPNKNTKIFSNVQKIKNNFEKINKQKQKKMTPRNNKEWLEKEEGWK